MVWVFSDARAAGRQREALCASIAGGFSVKNAAERDGSQKVPGIFYREFDPGSG